LICISNSSSTFSVPATPAEKPSAVAAAAPTKTVKNVKQLFTQQKQLLHTMQKLHCFFVFSF
jgi:cell division septal protein FtsQ